MSKKKRLIERQNPNSDTLGCNLRQVARAGHFSLITAQLENSRRHSGEEPSKGPEEIIENPRAARKVGTDITR